MNYMRKYAPAVLLLVVLVGCSDESGSKRKIRKSGNTTGGADIAEVDPERGRAVFASTCVTCHGQHGQGMPNQGIQIRRSKFIAEKTDQELLEYLKVGRPINSPDNKSGILMPPRGGNSALDDAQLKDVVAFLRVLQKEEME
jgi:mono/diheme cytochrome c family protein